MHARRPRIKARTQDGEFAKRLCFYATPQHNTGGICPSHRPVELQHCIDNATLKIRVHRPPVQYQIDCESEVTIGTEDLRAWVVKRYRS